MLKWRNSNFKLLVTLLNNAQAGKRVNVTGSSHLLIAGVSPIFKNTHTIGAKIMRNEEISSRKAELFQPPGDMFEILQMRIGKQYAYMLGGKRYAVDFSIKLLKFQAAIRQALHYNELFNFSKGSFCSLR